MNEDDKPATKKSGADASDVPKPESTAPETTANEPNDQQQEATEAPAPDSQWTFSGDEAQQAARRADRSTPKQASVQWTASEFINHQKSFVWYVLLAVSALIAGGLVYLVTRGDKITAAVIPCAAIFLGIMAARKPRTLDYEISPSGITIGQRFHPYATMKSFSVTHDGAFSSISFMPLKRFMPFVTMYYAPKDEEKIVGLLSSYLPIEPARRDLLDHFLERIRF